LAGRNDGKRVFLTFCEFIKLYLQVFLGVSEFGHIFQDMQSMDFHEHRIKDFSLLKEVFLLGHFSHMNADLGQGL